jgi:hypothetical protein
MDSENNSKQEESVRKDRRVSNFNSRGRPYKKNYNGPSRGSHSGRGGRKSSYHNNSREDTKEKEPKESSADVIAPSTAELKENNDAIIAELSLDLKVGTFVLQVYKNVIPSLLVHHFIQSNHLNNLLPPDLLEKYKIAISSYVHEIQEKSKQ